MYLDNSTLHLFNMHLLMYVQYMFVFNVFFVAAPNSMIKHKNISNFLGAKMTKMNNGSLVVSCAFREFRMNEFKDLSDPVGKTS